MKEIWKCIENIEGFEGLYEVSNLGKVKSLRSNIILKPNYDKYGYEYVTFTKSPLKKSFKIHRLVAQAFIPNPDNLPQVNHKDENKTNNNVKNLEWCDAKYNNNYGNRNKKIGKPVIGVNKNTNEIVEFYCSREAERVLKIDNSSISKCCKGKIKYAGEYYWSYA